MRTGRPAVQYRIIRTPLGPFALCRDAAGEVSSTWPGVGSGIPAAAVTDESLMPALARQLEQYFAGDAVSFDDVPTPRGTEFARRCWDAARTIPRGQTRTYAELAGMAGSPGAARAAGQAMKRNPLPVIVPCHRVVSAEGLGGYCGRMTASRGLEIKRHLLELEGALS
jgi:methylated-DNA-[protein]-cysteine S-methyltransferase